MGEIRIRVTPKYPELGEKAFTAKPCSAVVFGDGGVERAYFDMPNEPNGHGKYKNDMYDLELVIPRIAELEAGYVGREATGEGPGYTQEEARYWHKQCLRMESRHKAADGGTK